MVRQIHYLASALLMCGAGLNIAGCGKVSLTPDAAVTDAAVDGSASCAEPPCYAVVASKPLDNRDLDLLFVIDNSGSMYEEQVSLAANFSRFLSALENLEGGLPSLHVGVVSTDLGAEPYNLPNCEGNGDNGVLQSTPQGQCTGPNGAFIQDTLNPDGTRTRNYDGTLSDTFACIARLGTSGCGFEQQLESMRRALDGRNAGFLRPDANLGVVFVTDEDDCSVFDTAMYDPSQTTLDSPLGPLSSFRCFEFGVECANDPDPREAGPRQDCQPRSSSPYMHGAQEYIDFLRGLKPSPEQVMVAGIIGDPVPVAVGNDPQTGNPMLLPSCTSGAGQAAPGVRLRAFLDGFPNRYAFGSICNENLSDILTSLGSMFTRWLHSACLVGAIKDTDPGAPGLQYECKVTQVAPGAAEAEIPVCDNPAAPSSSSSLPCYLIGLDSQQCGATDSRLAVTLYRGTAPIPAGARADVSCVIE
jgi:hypothetical protein